MKTKMLKNIVLGVMVFLLIGCKQVAVETDLEDTYVQFTPKFASAGYADIINYNFSYFPGKTQDTIWVDIQTRGLIASSLRHISIEPVRENLLAENHVHAESGKHFVAFNNPDIKQFYTLLPNTSKGRIPIILLRHPDMATNTVQLSVELVASPDLLPGVTLYKRIKVLVNDGLTRPANWNLTLLGSYGKVKHDFLIRNTGKRFDDAFLTTLGVDVGLQNYYKVRLPQILEEENKQRKEQSLLELREIPSDPYSKVEFPK